MKKICLGIVLATFLLISVVWAQSLKGIRKYQSEEYRQLSEGNQRTEFEYSDYQKQAVQAGVQLKQGMPVVLERIEEAILQIEEGNQKGCQESLTKAQMELDTVQLFLDRDEEAYEPYQEIKNYLGKIIVTLRQAEKALERNLATETTRLLGQASDYLKALKDIPALQLTNAQISLEQASNMIANQDYSGANGFIEQAQKDLAGAQAILGEDHPAVREVKNKIILANIEKNLLKLDREKALKNFYPGNPPRPEGAPPPLQPTGLYNCYTVWDADGNCDY